jgi:hypothetical protein
MGQRACNPQNPYHHRPAAGRLVRPRKRDPQSTGPAAAPPSEPCHRRRLIPADKDRHPPQPVRRTCPHKPQVRLPLSAETPRTTRVPQQPDRWSPRRRQPTPPHWLSWHTSQTAYPSRSRVGEPSSSPLSASRPVAPLCLRTFHLSLVVLVFYRSRS